MHSVAVAVAVAVIVGVIVPNGVRDGVTVPEGVVAEGLRVKVTEGMGNVGVIGVGVRVGVVVAVGVCVAVREGEGVGVTQGLINRSVTVCHAQCPPGQVLTYPAAHTSVLDTAAIPSNELSTSPVFGVLNKVHCTPSQCIAVLSDGPLLVQQ